MTEHTDTKANSSTKYSKLVVADTIDVTMIPPGTVQYISELRKLTDKLTQQLRVTAAIGGYRVLHMEIAEKGIVGKDDVERIEIRCIGTVDLADLVLVCSASNAEDAQALSTRMWPNALHRGYVVNRIDTRMLFGHRDVPCIIVPSNIASLQYRMLSPHIRGGRVVVIPCPSVEDTPEN